MNTQNKTPLTRGDLAEFCALLCEGLNPRKTGDVVQPHEPMTLGSDDIAEDGRRIRFYDLLSGRTGCQADDGAITIVD
ncbi:MAG: hypothetical protein Q8P42_06100 [Gallionella sp.]|nr:hypothetical protein [Gallionella sp.]